MRALEEILALIDDIDNIMEDLLSSGFNAVHDFTIKELGRLGALSEGYGMKTCSEMLNNLKETLDKKRHNFDFEYEKTIEEYFKINKYLMLCRRKLEVNKAINNLKK